MTTRETELERQLSHIVKECEASSTQSKRIQRIKARAEAAINGSDPDFKSVGDRRDDKIAHIGQLNMMNAQLQSTIAALEAEVMRLREIIEKLWVVIDDIDTYSDMAKADDKLYRSLVERRQKDRWGTRINCDGHKLEFPTPFTSTALNELIEKAEKMTIERCAIECEKWFEGVVGNKLRAIPTGQIKLEELL